MRWDSREWHNDNICHCQKLIKGMYNIMKEWKTLISRKITIELDGFNIYVH